MFELVYAGIDTLDLAIKGCLSVETLKILEAAREEANESQAQALRTIGPGKVDVHVSGHGLRGGYTYVIDTGPVGFKIFIKKNSAPSQWNLFVSIKATTLLSNGTEGSQEHLWDVLQRMGALITDHSINRVDFAMDFKTRNFELHIDQFVAHAHAKVRPYWGDKPKQTDKNQPSAVIRGRQLESVTIGKQPGRQITVYDKRREAISRQKKFWFKAWDIDPKDPSIEVWRVEIRAGKKELKDRWQIRRFEDLDAAIGDVCLHALSEVRYLADRQTDSNVTRQQLHPLWKAAIETVTDKLAEFRSGLLPGQIIEIERELAQERYITLITSNGIGLGVALGLSDEDIKAELPDIVRLNVMAAIEEESERVSKSIKRARERLHFVSHTKTTKQNQEKQQQPI